MNQKILDAIDRATGSLAISNHDEELSRARVRLAMMEIAQLVLDMVKDGEAQTRLRFVEQVLENYVGCSVDKLVVRHIDLLRQQPVDLDKLMIAVGGQWAAKARSIIAEEKDRKAQSKAFVDRQAPVAPVMGFRDQNGKKISEEEARARVKSAGGSGE